ncbi:hypothetical protein Dda_4902 [Drechslerella dactyloides]|uniref:Nephrocystin 3-like N-terminal domain-containing protein n=1 Tax=Drechslerella dactyloides TaxID=74499 RepID=A0AAD6IXR9_DREDA|nr:hypothetical protein Dda_4902 [Drechslerella dactyloides]
MASSQTSVSDLTKACISKFERCLETKDAAQRGTLENRMADLNLWADGVGAVAKHAASLDWRFRSRPEDLHLVKAMLSMLARFLDEFASQAQSGDAVSNVLHGIDAAIENLALIGVAIRRTGKASRIQKADQMFDREMHHELRQHLECIVLLRPSADGHKALDISELSAIQKRLIDANLRRRNRFLRAHQHYLHLVDQQPDLAPLTEEPTPEPVPVAKVQMNPLPEPSPQLSPPARRLERRQGQDATGFSTASTAEGALQYKQTSSLNKEVAKTQITSLAADADYPRPPASASHLDETKSAALLLEWLEETELEPEASPKLQLADLEKGDPFEPEPESEIPTDWFNYNDDYFADNPADGSARPETDDEESRHLSSLPSGTGNSQTSVRSAKTDIEGSEDHSTPKSDQKQHPQETSSDRESIAAISNWLSPIDYSSDLSDNARLRTPGTGQWLLDSVEFKTWLDQSGQTLYCRGIIGAGKTVLASFVMEHLSKVSSLYQDSTAGIAYISFDPINGPQTPTQHLANLLKQLALGRSFIPENLQMLFYQHTTRNTSPSFTELMAHLRIVTAEHSRDFIVIDAIDQGDSEQHELLSGLCELQQRTEINLLVMSRNAPGRLFQRAATLDVNAKDEDVRKHIRDYVYELSRKPDALRNSILFIREDLRIDIEETISEAAQGMFFLATRYLKLVNEQRSTAAAGKFLRHIRARNPALESYALIYDNVSRIIRSNELSTKSRIATKALSWTIRARGALTFEALQHATSIEIGDDAINREKILNTEYIVAACQGLLAPLQRGNKSFVQWSHWTAQKYAEETMRDWTPMYTHDDADIATTCVTYLSLEDFDSGFSRTDESFEERLRRYPLYQYAAKHWGYHARIASTSIDSERFAGFLLDDAKIEAATQSMFAYGDAPDYSQRFPKRWTGFHLAAYFGLTYIIHFLLKKGLSSEKDLADSYRQTPLFLAAANGHEHVIRVLIGNDGGYRRKVDARGVAIEPEDKNGLTPTSVAAAKGYPAIVELLLAEGVDPNIKNGQGFTPLWLAAVNGHKAVVELLMKSAANLELTDRNDQTPLSVAAERGYKDIVKLLVDAGADVNSMDRNHSTPILLATAYGHRAVVEMLIIAGADMESRDENLQAPISVAAEKGYKEIVELLLDSGVDVNTQYADTMTPMALAASNGHGAVVELLIARGGDVNLVMMDLTTRRQVVRAIMI